MTYLSELRAAAGVAAAAAGAEASPGRRRYSEATPARRLAQKGAVIIETAAAEAAPVGVTEMTIT